MELTNKKNVSVCLAIYNTVIEITNGKINVLRSASGNILTCLIILTFLVGHEMEKANQKEVRENREREGGRCTCAWQ